MARLADTVDKIRSKNAGPFWVTIDIFCGSPEAFETVTKTIATEAVARLYRVSPETLKRFDIPGLNVVKFSFPRPVPQGAATDRDQHGAQYAVLLEELEIG